MDVQNSPDSFLKNSESVDEKSDGRLNSDEKGEKFLQCVFVVSHRIGGGFDLSDLRFEPTLFVRKTFPVQNRSTDNLRVFN